MGKKLVIVESPSKSKTIEKYLGSDYKVVSSKGHIRDLATTGKYGLGVDVENGFTPKYIPIKGKANVIKDLKKDVKNMKPPNFKIKNTDIAGFRFRMYQARNLQMYFSIFLSIAIILQYKLWY